MINWLKKVPDSPIWDWIWGAFFLLLPITSMPAVVRLVKSDVVAAPSGILLVIVLFGWCLPVLLRGAKIPGNAFPILLFGIVAVLCTLFSFFYQIPDYKSHNALYQSLTAIITLLAGFGFYFAVMLRTSDQTLLKQALRLINVSGAIVLGWTLLQAFFWYSSHSYPHWMRSIQFFLSAGSLYRQRFVGFTLEPSWLAHQLNLLYLPWWFAATLEKYTVHKRKPGRFSIENILLLVGSLVLFLTLSRIGLLSFGLMVLYWLLTRGYGILDRKFGLSGKSAWKRASIVLLLLLFFMLLFFLSLLFLTKLDFRMAKLFQLQLAGRDQPLMVMAEELGMASRMVYWDAGWDIFTDYPFFGVGLGHAGFYIPDRLSSFAMQLEEVRRLLFRSDTLLNIKSLWVRLLAETGVAGFSLFVIWLLNSWGTAQRVISIRSGLKKTVGRMGILILIGMLMEGFSVDTFALPYFWVGLGMVAAVSVAENAPDEYANG